MHIVLPRQLSIHPSFRLSPLAVFSRPNSTNSKRDCMGHSVEEVGRVKRMGCSSECANPACGELFRLVVLSGPEGIMKPNAEKNLLEGDKERWNPDREVLARHFVSPFQKMFTREEAEEELKAKISALVIGSVEKRAVGEAGTYTLNKVNEDDELEAD
jgi:hypothetical protein